MLIGVPREIKRDEYRVAMLPVGVEELSRAGHQVLIEANAGVGSGIPMQIIRLRAPKSLRLRLRSVAGQI